MVSLLLLFLHEGKTESPGANAEVNQTVMGIEAVCSVSTKGNLISLIYKDHFIEDFTVL